MILQELTLLLLFATAAKSAMELPKFKQLKLLYPGYYLHGGTYRDHQVLELIGGEQRHSLETMHNTASLRMSWALNQYGGRHAIGKGKPIFLSGQGQDSVTGKSGQEYIFRNTAFGPFLSAKYGSPMVTKPDKHDHDHIMAPFMGKQGIVSLVSYKKHAGGHTGLWDCKTFYQSKDWSTEVHIISVIFWETPDSYCAPDPLTSPPTPHLQIVSDPNLQVIARHNLQPSDLAKVEQVGRGNGPRTRHNRRSRKGQNEPVMWSQ